MNKLIIFEQNNIVAIMKPTGVFSVEETARRDVPKGTEYWIVEASDLPTDMDEFRDAWQLDRDILGEPTGIALGIDDRTAEQNND